MFPSDDAQRKRRIEGNESTWAFEKKQRVEQLVTALARPDKRSSSSDTVELEGQEVNEDINIDVVSTDDPPSPIASPHGKVNMSKPSLYPSTKLVTSKSPHSSTKPVAKVVHFSPKIIHVESMAETQPTLSKKGLFVPPVPLQPLMKQSHKEAPRTMTRVPRDHNVPLIVYNPPRQKPQAPTAVIPVLPMTTVGNLIIQAPIFAGGMRPPPTLIPASQLKKLSKQPANFIHTKPQKPARVQKEKKQLIVPKIKKEEIEDEPECLDIKKTTEFAQWTIKEVHEHFMKSDCKEYAHIFLEQEIDGKALCLLDEMNISKLLNVKMGPAIKLSANIRALNNR